MNYDVLMTMIDELRGIYCSLDTIKEVGRLHNIELFKNGVQLDTSFDKAPVAEIECIIDHLRRLIYDFDEYASIQLVNEFNEVRWRPHE